MKKNIATKYIGITFAYAILGYLILSSHASDQVLSITFSILEITTIILIILILKGYTPEALKKHKWDNNRGIMIGLSPLIIVGISFISFIISVNLEKWLNINLLNEGFHFLWANIFQFNHIYYLLQGVLLGPICISLLLCSVIFELLSGKMNRIVAVLVASIIVALLPFPFTFFIESFFINVYMLFIYKRTNSILWPAFAYSFAFLIKLII
ncbi:MAG: CPBP family glutamic-type intramembrane protease [Anaerovoracaceae bacterium]